MLSKRYKSTEVDNYEENGRLLDKVIESIKIVTFAI